MAQLPHLFNIIHRNGQGTPDFIYPYESTLVACVVTPINITRGYLRHATVLAGFVVFAKNFGRSIPNAWYKDPYYGYKNTEDVVHDFICIILAEFPSTCIDDSIQTPECIAAHPRRAWDGRFQPSDQSILLNGPMVHEMVAANLRARQSNDRSDYDNKHLRKFVFIFANAIFHEICHMLVTFLTKGRTNTPPHIRPEVEPESSKKNIGEAGRYLEEVIFGGTLAYYRDNPLDNSQPGNPYILTPHGGRRIPQATIDAILSHHYHFPYHLEGPFVHTGNLEQFGEHYPPAHPTDPMTWPIMHEFKRHKHRLRMPGVPGYASYQHLSHPGVRAQAGRARPPGGSAGRR